MGKRGIGIINVNNYKWVGIKPAPYIPVKYARKICNLYKSRIPEKTIGSAKAIYPKCASSMGRPVKRQLAQQSHPRQYQPFLK